MGGGELCEGDGEGGESDGEEEEREGQCEGDRCSKVKRGKRAEGRAKQRTERANKWYGI
jgi:hypothetical protein